MPALDHLFERGFHVIAEIIKAEFVIGAVSDVSGVSLTALRIIQSMYDATGLSCRVVRKPGPSIPRRDWRDNRSP